MQGGGKRVFSISQFCRLAITCTVVWFGSISNGYSQAASGQDFLPDKFLDYAVGCALDPKTSVQIDGLTYQGSLGLAPGWLQNPLTVRERRLVSSCLLARTNALGVSVQVSLRGSAPHQVEFPALRADASEREQFSLFEGAFYGDLFDEHPKAYVCLGDRHQDVAASLHLKHRLCSLAGPEGTDPKTSICGFIVTGSCADKGVFTQNGTHYPDPIYVYLDPSIGFDAQIK